MIPLFSLAGEKTLHLREMLAKAAKVDEKKDIVATDVSVYNPQSGEKSSAALYARRDFDDLQCAFASLTAFLNAKDGGLPVLCLFDNEEVGSQTKRRSVNVPCGHA